MTDSEKNFIRGMIFLGLPLIAAGGAILWYVFTNELEIPSWVGISLGLMFFSAGVTTALMDSLFNPLREKTWFAYFQAFTLLSIPLLLLLLFNWVAFGPGERVFSLGLSNIFVSYDFGQGNEFIGRAAFGIVALLVDIVVGVGVIAVLIGWIKKGLHPKD